MIRMRKTFLLIMLLAAGILFTVQAETASSLPVDGFSALITISVESSLEPVLSGEDIVRVEQEISTVFLSALTQTARFSNIEIGSVETDLSDYDSDMLIVNLTISQVLIETDPDSGKKIFHAEAAAESYSNDQQANDSIIVDFKLLGIGETFEESLQLAGVNLKYSVMSIIRLFPIPGESLAIYDLYNNYPLVLFTEESILSIGDEYNLVSGTGEVLGLAEISRLVPLEESGSGSGSSAAELQIIYTDISIVPGIGLRPSESSSVQIQSAVSLSYGAVGADISISGTKGQGFVPSAGAGAVWVWDDPYPAGSIFTQQANTVIPMISGGFSYRMIPGRRLSKPGNLFIDRARIDLGASFVGGYLFNLTSPIGNGLIYGGRYTAGVSWYVTAAVEISARCQYNRIYQLSGSSDPILSAIFGAAGVTFRP
ncbi:MAG: hypothetical protein HQ557_00350 [Bacteroidetes bacterium]|nr:hypothetical protein [Bacteroidota bacterium]